MKRQTHQSIVPNLRAALLGAAVLAGAAGCQSRGTDFTAFVQEPRPLVTSMQYRLAPPDAVVIVSKRVREINGHIETIRPDGHLTLPLLGSTFVAGKTVEQVSAERAETAQDPAGVRRVAAHGTGHDTSAGELGVVGVTTVHVAEHVPGCARPLESLLCAGISRVAVGMGRHGNLAPGELDHRHSGVFPNAENLVVGRFRHASFQVRSR